MTFMIIKSNCYSITATLDYRVSPHHSSHKTASYTNTNCKTLVGKAV